MDSSTPKPQNIDEYKKWLKKQHGYEITFQTENYYDSVTRKVKESLEKQHKQFGEMLSQLKEVNTMLFLRLYVEGAPKQMWVLDKYLVEGRKVIGILGQ